MGSAVMQTKLSNKLNLELPFDMEVVVAAARSGGSGC